jgi:hypothetical protein
LEHVRVLRQMSRERVHWCRYLEMIEDLSKSMDRRITFSELPARRCRCEKFKWESTSESVASDRVIRDFKAEYCESCTAREPKKRSGSK